MGNETLATGASAWVDREARIRHVDSGGGSLEVLWQGSACRSRLREPWNRKRRFASGIASRCEAGRVRISELDALTLCIVSTACDRVQQVTVVRGVRVA